jgi:transcriptional regulator with XRE-family HTH domain
MSNFWQDPIILNGLYNIKEFSTHEIADKLGCSQSTISNWLNKLKIDHPGPDEAKRKVGAGYGTRKSEGKSQAYTYSYSGTSKYVDHVAMHRLLAVSEYGVEAVKDMDVHHLNEIKWDNRPENIELMEPQKHRAMHNRQKDWCKD